MRRLAPLIARLAGTASRRLGRGGGTTLPGVVLLRLDPDAIARRGRRLARGSVTVSATNGKTTTARLLRSIVDTQRWPTVANTAGSNLASGIASALLAAPRDTEFALLEVDEAHLPEIARQMPPRAMVLMNLFRDQLDRYGELETLVAKWRTMIEALPDTTVLVLNADDPALAHLDGGTHPVLRFGVNDTTVDRGGLAHAADSTHCPVCNTPLEYLVVSIGHLGHWRCPACGHARPDPDVAVTSVTLRGGDGADIELLTPSGPLAVWLGLPGLHNVYNAAAAVTAGLALGIPLAPMADALATTGAAFGRGERVKVDDRELVLLLAKNPTGANENVRTVLADPDPLHVLLLLNDRTADGQDVSWIWDVDYEPLLARATTLTLGGDRVFDLALRLRYSDVPETRMTTHTTIAGALDAAVGATEPGGRVHVLPTYTAMLDLRALLAERGVVGAFWEDR